MTISRKQFIVGGLALGAAGSVIGLKPKNIGGKHSDYFIGLSNALAAANISKPSLVIDKQKLLKNVKTLRSHIKSESGYRIVAKSLPSIPLIKLLMTEARTNKLMVFHRPFLNEVIKEIPTADILMGKPMPVRAARNFYRASQDDAGAVNNRLQWLIDSARRLKQYKSLANELSVPMRINIELDVGLHRGGVVTDEELKEMLTLIADDDLLQFSGFMGYEPHIAKAPGDPIKHRDKAMKIYQGKVDVAEAVLKRSIQDLTLNCGGSPTYQYYNEGSYPHNELSSGSCLVKPAHFDIDSLTDHIPASYIATPVIKAGRDTQIPGANWAANIMSLWNPNRKKTFFIYGGFWKATIESPKGLATNPLFGHSTNQEMYNGSPSVELEEDDFVFFRPDQSEFVFLQFGDIAVYDGNKVIDFWPVL